MTADVQEYTFEGGYPDETTVQRAFDDADLVRAIRLYKQFCAFLGNALLFALYLFDPHVREI